VSGHDIVLPVVLRPGDSVLLCTLSYLPPEAAQQMKDTLAERFPGVTFSIIDGISGLAVQPAAHPPTSEDGVSPDDR
jgi:hypothetical protein